MFEFHGWINVRIAGDDVPIDAQSAREQAALAEVRATLDAADDRVSLFHLSDFNGIIVLAAHGRRNHRYQPVLDLFRRVAARFPDAYGLLYIHDDEPPGAANAFVAWCVRGGELTEHADPFLSPLPGA